MFLMNFILTDFFEGLDLARDFETFQPVFEVSESGHFRFRNKKWQKPETAILNAGGWSVTKTGKPGRQKPCLSGFCETSRAVTAASANLFTLQLHFRNPITGNTFNV
jgi:hypothetical protein